MSRFCSIPSKPVRASKFYVFLVGPMLALQYAEVRKRKNSHTLPILVNRSYDMFILSSIPCSNSELSYQARTFSLILHCLIDHYIPLLQTVFTSEGWPNQTCKVVYYALFFVWLATVHAWIAFKAELFPMDFYR